MPYAHHAPRLFALPRIPRITVIFNGQEVYLNPLAFAGSIVAGIGGLIAEMSTTSTGQNVGVWIGIAGVLGAIGAILVPLGTKWMDMRMVAANFKGQLAEMGLQLAEVGRQLTFSNDRLTMAERDRDRLQGLLEKVQATAEHGQKENRDLTKQAITVLSDKIDSTVQKTSPQ